MKKLLSLSFNLCLAFLCVSFVSCSDDNEDPSTPIIEDEVTIGQEVDLGLSVKWAGWNVGASSPEQYGCYYAWGETEGKNDYTGETYKYWVDSDGDGYYDDDEFANIGKNISGTQYDVARQKWGGSWRMPTKADFDELIQNCKWTWCQYKGVNGYKVTGSNGNSIFLPAAGIYNGSSLVLDGSNGCYWSDQLNDDDITCGLEFDEYGDYSSYESFFCARGLTVRPVK